MPNRTNPEAWKDEVTLNRLSSEALLLFYRLQHIRSDEERFPIIPSPHEPRNIHGSLYYLRTQVRCTDIARWLDELQKAGVILVANSERGWYGEIPEYLRYRKGDFEKGATRVGPRAPRKPAEQSLLPLPPMGLMKPAHAKPETFKHSDYDYDHGNDPDSIRPAQSVLPAPNNPMNRGLCRDEKETLPAVSEGAKHARNVELLFGTGLGTRLAKFLGPQQTIEEMSRSGANWLRIVSDCACDLVEILDQGERAMAHDPELKTGLGKAKFLTRRLSDRKLWKAA